jgi:CRISPR/Cas system CMR-associated protein Cmr1 (group 7 of RAMP superfamily)
MRTKINSLKQTKDSSIASELHLLITEAAEYSWYRMSVALQNGCKLTLEVHEDQFSIETRHLKSEESLGNNYGFCS